MKSLLKLVRKLDDYELRHVSKAIDRELSRRMEQFDPIPESAPRRASAPLARAVELRQMPERRAA